MRHAISMSWLVKFQIETMPLLIIFGAHMNVSFIIKVMNPVLIKWSNRCAPVMLTIEIEPRMVIIFWACSPISSKHMSFWNPFLEPHLITYHSTKGVQLRSVIELGTSTYPYRSLQTGLCLLLCPGFNQLAKNSLCVLTLFCRCWIITQPDKCYQLLWSLQNDSVNNQLSIF